LLNDNQKKQKVILELSKDLDNANLYHIAYNLKTFESYDLESFEKHFFNK